jgi:glycosyltransferase involved in cell wall biosynthesis
VAWHYNANANYRALQPGKAMARRGHEVIWPSMSDGAPELERLTGCDVVHVYRRFDPVTRAVLAKLAERGTKIVYDNDDDFTALPKGAPAYKTYGGLKGKRAFAEMVALARMAKAFTTTSPVLAATFRRAGVERAEVIPNAVVTDFELPLMTPEGLIVGWQPEAPGPPVERRPGFTVGWVAGLEHKVDALQLGITAALRRLVAEHPEVRVETIGVRLPMIEGYTHLREVPFHLLGDRMATWDVGIAPLVDIPFNAARSDIKLKEYAAAGLPWLASPVGPYQGLGEAEGGRLVDHDGWFEALRALVVDAGERDRLAGNARAWAADNMFDSVAGTWERLFLEVGGPRARPAPKQTPPTGMTPGVRFRLPSDRIDLVRRQG